MQPQGSATEGGGRRRPSLYEQRLAEQKRKQQEEEERRLKDAADNVRRRSINKRWEDAIQEQLRQEQERLEKLKRGTIDGTDLSMVNVKALLAEMYKMFLARANSDHIIRSTTKFLALRAASTSLPDVIQMGQAHAVATPVYTSFLEKILTDNDDKPQLLPVGIRGCGRLSGINPPISAVAMVMRMPDGQPAICFSFEPQPGQQFNPTAYGPIELAIYDLSAHQKLLEGTLTVEPEGGWEQHRELLHRKIQSVETFLVRQIVRGEDGVDVEMVLASHKLLYHERCPDYPFVPLGYVDASLFDPLRCSVCDVLLEGPQQHEPWACPQTRILLCNSCAREGHGVLASTDTKQIELNRNVYFNLGTSVIAEASFQTLDQVARVLFDHPLKVRIEGHGNYVRPDGSLANDETRNKGEEKCTLLELSQRRAQRVASYLCTKDVPRTLVHPIGLGGSRLITTDPERISENMRVEIHFMTDNENVFEEAAEKEG